MQGNNRSNGLVILYEAAMLIEHQSLKPQRPTFPPAIVSRRPLSGASLITGHALLHPKAHQPHLQQQHHQPPSPTAGFRVPIRVPMGPGGRVKLEPSVALSSSSSNTSSLLMAQQRRSSAGQTFGSRSSHNELEKNRRAHLRQCLDYLRDQLPMSTGQANRLTMLNVLNRSLSYLKELQGESIEQAGRLTTGQRRQKELAVRRDQLRRQLRNLRRQLSQQAAVKKASAAAAAAAAAAASAKDAWRSRNASEISAASASSEEMELSAMEATCVGAAVARAGRSAACDSPDSGYATPPTCPATATAAAAAVVA